MHIGRAGIGQHLGREVAGEGARFLGVAILTADGDPRADGALGEQADQGRGRADGELDLGLQAGRVAGMDLRPAPWPSVFNPFIFQLPATSGRGLSTLM